jgi:hypothetical protein
VIHGAASPQTLGFVRACVYFIWLVKIVPDSVTFLGELPLSVFQPVGLLQFIPDAARPHLVDAGFLTVFKGVLVLSLVLAMAGAKPYRIVSVTAAVLLTLHQSLVRSFTFINHQELGILFAAYALAVFPAADGFAWPASRKPTSPPHIYGGALTSMAVLLVVPYAAIAAFRLAHGGPGIFLGDSMLYWLGSLSNLDADGWSLGLAVLQHPALAFMVKLSFPLTTMFELLSPLCLVWSRFRKLWIPVMVLFHCFSWFLLNIFFWENVLLILLLFTDVDDWFTRVRHRFARRWTGEPIADDRAGA